MKSSTYISSTPNDQIFFTMNLSIFMNLSTSIASNKAILHSTKPISTTPSNHERNVLCHHRFPPRNIQSPSLPTKEHPTMYCTINTPIMTMYHQSGSTAVCFTWSEITTMKLPSDHTWYFTSANKIQPHNCNPFTGSNNGRSHVACEQQRPRHTHTQKRTTKTKRDTQKRKKTKPKTPTN